MRVGYPGRFTPCPVPLGNSLHCSVEPRCPGGGSAFECMAVPCCCSIQRIPTPLVSVINMKPWPRPLQVAGPFHSESFAAVEATSSPRRQGKWIGPRSSSTWPSGVGWRSGNLVSLETALTPMPLKYRDRGSSGTQLEIRSGHCCRWQSMESSVERYGRPRGSLELDVVRRPSITHLRGRPPLIR